MIRGTVLTWNDDEGWGVLVAPEVPGEIWAHFVHIEAEGYRSLEPNATVLFEYEAPEGGQDGYTYRATRIRKAEDEPDDWGQGGQTP